MSKTNKIRRLKRQVENLKNDLWVSEFTNKQLIQDASVCPKPFRMEHPPEVRSNCYDEEQYFNHMMNYIYRQMENEIQMCYDLDPYCDHTKFKFELYLDDETHYKLARISGMSQMRREKDGDYFCGHKIVRVATRECHVRLVRVK